MFADMKFPDIYSFYTSDVQKVNGSCSTEHCSHTQQSRNMMCCGAAKSSVLFDGIISTLNFSSDTWASQLFELQPFERNNTAIFIDLFSEVILSTVEVVMFNCPEWGIAVQSIRFHVSGVVSSITTSTTTSCDSLVTVHLPILNREFTHDQLKLEFLTNSQKVYIAEVRLFTDGDCPRAAPTEGTGFSVLDYSCS